MAQKEFKGRDGILTITDTGVTISKKRFRDILFGGFRLRGDKTIPYSGIIAVELKRGGITVGYIRITLQGSASITGGLLESAIDSNSITFSAGKNKLFEEAKQLIEERIGNHNKKTSGLDDLEKLALLKEKGVITEEEFSTKKKQLLGI